MLAFMDETACQSVTNVRRVLHAPNTKNIQVHCGERLKINVVGFMGVNCSSYMETNERGDSINFVKSLCHFRMENILNTTKGACELMMHGAIESSTTNVHNAFTQSFNEALTNQNEIYAKMTAKGWYHMEQVEQQKINQTRQKYASKLN